MSDDLALRPATELAQRLRRRELSALELLQHHLRRVERLNPALNAVVVFDTDVALQRARDADAALARGECWGPLHGLPMTVKESFDVAGLPTTWGFESMRGNIAKRPAWPCSACWTPAHVVFGKTNVPVALADWQTFNPVYGTTNNPWDVTRTPGRLVGRLGRGAGRWPDRRWSWAATSARRSAIRRTTAACGATSRPGAWYRCRASNCPATNVLT